jgi:vacuolar-type H+-ATPase subunit F/Vma7
MKNLLITIILLTIVGISNAQNMASKELEQRIATIENKMAIKEVIDVFSNLADTKEIDKQVLLFSEDGIVESITNGQSNVLKGREQLKQAFTGFLSGFEIVYHQNGQQTIDELTENTAKTTSYCQVILIGEQDGKQIKTTLYTIYNDSLVKKEDKWLIDYRKSNFIWREVEEVK